MCSTVSLNTPADEITKEILDIANELLSKLNNVLDGQHPNENQSDAIARLSSAYYMCIPYNCPTIPPLIDTHEKLHAYFQDVSCLYQHIPSKN